MAFVIRALSPADYAEWLRMRTALWPDVAEAEHENEMADISGSAWAIYVLERGDGRLGGFIELATRESVQEIQTDRIGYVEGWYVDPDLRRLGYGRALIAQAERWTLEQGLAELGSDALLDNELSIRSHKALGFTEVERLVLFIKPVRAVREKPTR